MAVSQGIRAGKAFVELFLNSEQLNAGLARARASMAAFGKYVTAGGAAMGGMGSRLTQVSYAVDDLTNVLGNYGLTTAGVSAAIRAMSNNIGTLVTSINPMAGIVTTLGLALAAFLIPQLFGTGEAAEEAASKLDAFTKAAETLANSAATRFDFEDNFRRIDSVFDLKAIDKELQDVRLKIMKLAAQRDTLRAASFSREGEAREAIEGQISNLQWEASKLRQLEAALNLRRATLRQGENLARTIQGGITGVTEGLPQLAHAITGHAKAFGELADALAKGQVEAVKLRWGLLRLPELRDKRHPGNLPEGENLELIDQLRNDKLAIQRLMNFAGLDAVQSRLKDMQIKRERESLGTFSGDARQFAFGQEQPIQKQQLDALDEIRQGIDRLETLVENGLQVA